jgi:hypothetical protein
MKIAVFWEKRFDNNNFSNTYLDGNLSPFKYLVDINGSENTISYDLLEKKWDKDDYVIFCFLTFSSLNIIRYWNMLWKYRKNKKYLFLFEPPVVSPLSYCRLLHVFFSRIYTWRDDLVGNQKYYKYIWPQSYHGMISKWLSFRKKKLITLIVGNKGSFFKNELYSERRKAIAYFDKLWNFEFYGRWWAKQNFKQKFLGSQYYRSYSGWTDDKITTLSRYKFCICFENMKDSPGYITEKIWDAFKARCVPIYWGASNVTDYIPENTFIDFRKYENNYQSLSSVLQNMEESEYNLYLENIEKFLKTSDAKKWFDQTWATDFLHNL